MLLTREHRLLIFQEITRFDTATGLAISTHYTVIHLLQILIVLLLTGDHITGAVSDDKLVLWDARGVYSSIVAIHRGSATEG